MGTVSVVSFNIVFIAERWLRHRGKLAPNTSSLQKGLSICAIIAAMVGAIGLILLTCLNDLHHNKAHDACLVIFMYASPLLPSLPFSSLSFPFTSLHFTSLH